MTAIADNSTQPRGARRTVRIGLILAVLILLIAVLALIAISPIPMRGAELFGGMVGKIKGNPGATAAWSLAAVVTLWLGVGLLAGIQEWLAGSRRAGK